MASGYIPNKKRPRTGQRTSCGGFSPTVLSTANSSKELFKVSN